MKQTQIHHRFRIHLFTFLFSIFLFVFSVALGQKRTFKEDYRFLNNHQELILLEGNSNNSKIILVPLGRAGL